MNNLLIEIKHVLTLDATLLALLQNFMNAKGSEVADNPTPKVNKKSNVETQEVIESITVEQLRAELAEIAKSNDGKTKVKELLKEFGVSKLTDIKVEDYQVLMKKIKEIK